MTTQSPDEIGYEIALSEKWGGFDCTSEEINKLAAMISQAIAQERERNAVFMSIGTDACSGCTDGRIGLFVKHLKCISCDPTAYSNQTTTYSPANERASKPTLVLPDHEAIKKEALKLNYSYGTKPYMAFILGGQYACDLIARLNAPTVCEEKCDE